MYCGPVRKFWIKCIHPVVCTRNIPYRVEAIVNDRAAPHGGDGAIHDCKGCDYVADMLVKLYELPALEPFLDKPRAHGYEIRKPIGPEKHVIIDWVKTHFSNGWASEVEMALMNRPITCFIAVKDRKMYGFAVYDATVLGFFGPTGVDEATRGQGLGSALLVACLHDMFAKGYAYGVIGGAGPVQFYEKVVGATEIPGSKPGIYRGYITAAP